MLENLGEPEKILEPKYDCGPFSEDSQGMKFYQYFYGKMNFIDDEKGRVTIEYINLEGNYSIEINGISLDKTSNFDEVISQLGIESNKNYDKEIIYLVSREYIDERFLLIFEGGKLTKFDRWEPC